MWRKRHQRKQRRWRVVKLRAGILVTNGRTQRTLLEPRPAWKARIYKWLGEDLKYRELMGIRFDCHGNWTMTNPNLGRPLSQAVLTP